MEPEYNFSADAACAEPVAVPAVEVPAVPNTIAQPEVPVTAPQEQKQDTSGINIYADGISLSVGESNGQAIFDIVLNISWESEGNYQTAKVIKSVSFDKAKILSQVLSGTPVTVVEDKKAKDKEQAKQKMLNSMRELAGVAGNKTFV